MNNNFNQIRFHIGKIAHMGPIYVTKGWLVIPNRNFHFSTGFWKVFLLYHWYSYALSDQITINEFYGERKGYVSPDWPTNWDVGIFQQKSDICCLFASLSEVEWSIICSNCLCCWVGSLFLVVWWDSEHIYIHHLIVVNSQSKHFSHCCYPRYLSWQCSMLASCCMNQKDNG